VSNAQIDNIVKIDRHGNGTVFASTQLNSPGGLAFDSAGNLYAVNYFTVTRIAPDGTTSIFTDSGLNGPSLIAIWSPRERHDRSMEDLDRSRSGETRTQRDSCR